MRRSSFFQHPGRIMTLRYLFPLGGRLSETEISSRPLPACRFFKRSSGSNFIATYISSLLLRCCLASCFPLSSSLRPDFSPPCPLISPAFAFLHVGSPPTATLPCGRYYISRRPLPGSFFFLVPPVHPTRNVFALHFHCQLSVGPRGMIKEQSLRSQAEVFSFPIGDLLPTFPLFGAF